MRTLLTSFLVLALAAACPAEDKPKEGKRRNPFEVEDVKDPDGEDVKQAAKKVKLLGDAKDKNADKWATVEVNGKAGSLDGDWEGRWLTPIQSGTAKIKTTAERAFILYTDVKGLTKGTYLVDAAREPGGRLVGRWVQVGKPENTGAFVGLVVDDERIDAVLGLGEGDRWDFRRKLKK